MNKPKRFVAWILTLLMLIGVLPMSSLTVFAADPWEGYIAIDSADKLKAINTTDGMKKNYYLTQDIDLSSFNNWESLGWIGDSDTPFTGIFDGNGKTIKGLTMTHRGGGYVGLFAINEGTIKNLTIESPVIVGYIDVGAIVGRNNGLLESCKVTGGRITGKQDTTNTKTLYASANNLGGLAGQNGSNGTISKCGVIGTYIEGIRWLGGLTGVNYGKIEQSFVRGISINTQLRSPAWAENAAKVLVWDDRFVYSMAGSLVGESQGTISDCYAYNAALQGWDYIGGLVGRLATNKTTAVLKNVYAAEGKLSYYASYPWNQYTTLYPEYISLTIGELLYQPTYTGIYYTYTTNKMGVGEGHLKSSDKLKQQGTYTNWDFNNIWTLEASQELTANGGYPIFEWETRPYSPPVLEPVKPEGETLSALLDNLVAVTCTNTDASHTASKYALDITGFTQTDVLNGSYTISGTVNAAEYVEKYNIDKKFPHTIQGNGTQAISLTLTYDNLNMKWTITNGLTLQGVAASFDVSCPYQKLVQLLNDNLSVTVQCDSNAHKPIEYSYLASAVTLNPDASDYKKVTVTLSRDKYVEQYSNDTLVAHERYDKNIGDAVSYTAVYDDAQGEWSLTQTPDVMIINAKCDDSLPQNNKVTFYKIADVTEPVSIKGESGNWSVLKNYYITSNESLASSNVTDMPTTTTMPSNNYEFVKWVYFTNGSWVEFKSDTVINGNVDVYPLIKVKVSFDSKGGSAIAEQWVEHGAYAVQPNPAPARNGYDFQYWYSTDETTSFLFTASAITAPITLNAKWSPIVYTITYNLAGGAMEMNKSNPQTYTIETETFTLNNPLRQGYVFAGWTGTNTGTVVEIVKGSTGNREYTATWTAALDTKYQVKHYKENLDGTWKLDTTDSCTGTTDQKASVSPNTYAHFTYDSSMTTPSNPIIKGDGTLVVELYYKRDSYTITFQTEEGGTINGGSDDITYHLKYEAEFPALPQTQPDSDHALIGWHQNGALVTDWPTVVEGAAVYTAKWAPLTNVQYTVEHYTEGLDGQWYVESREIFTGTATEQASFTEKEYQHFTYDSSMTTPVNPIIKGDGTLIVKLYYKRDSYTITFRTDNGGTINGGTDDIFCHLKYEAAFPAIPSARPDSEHTFIGWYQNENRVIIWPSTVEGNAVYVAKWRMATGVPYTVEHYTEGLDGQWHMDDYELFSGTAGDQAAFTSRNYQHFTYAPSLTTPADLTIKGNGSLVIKLYYVRNSYTVTFQTEKGGAMNGSTNDISYTVKYQAAFPAVPSVRADANYSFVGWYQNGAPVRSWPDSVTENAVYVVKWNNGSSFTPVFPLFPVYPGLNPDITPAAPLSVVLEATKILNNGEMTGGEFDFVVYNGSTIVATGTNDENGNIKFTPITISIEGSYSYTIREIAGNDSSIAYDDTSFKVAIKAVERNGSLQYTVSYPADGVVFVNDALEENPEEPDDGEEIVDTPIFDTVNHYAYIIGYEDGTIRPEALISREEVAQIFYRILSDEYRAKYSTDENTFSDVASDRWSNTAISTLANIGVISGYPDGTFNPTGNITRAELAAIAARFDQVVYDGSSPFADVEGHWAEIYIKIASDKDWIFGYEDGSFNPDEYLKRCEMIAIINRILGRSIDSEDDMLNGMNEWVDNQDTSAWYYCDIQEATNSHQYNDDNDDKGEYWTELIPDRNW